MFVIFLINNCCFSFWIKRNAPQNSDHQKLEKFKLTQRIRHSPKTQFNCQKLQTVRLSENFYIYIASEVYGVPDLTANSLINAASKFFPIRESLLL